MVQSLRFTLLCLTGLLLIFTACSKKSDPVVAPAPGSISGQVLPAAALTTITAVNTDGNSISATPNAAGSFQLTGLAPGSYILSFTPAATYAAPLSVVVTVAAGVITQVPPITVAQLAGSLSGAITPAGAVTLVTVTDGAGHSTTVTPGSTGAFSLASLLPGSYTVAYTPAAGYDAPPTTPNVMVAAGQNTVLSTLTVSPNRTTLLTTPKWRITAYLASSSFGSQDLYAQIPACQRDDFYRFNLPNQLVLDEGATKCSVADVQTVTGTWALSLGQNALTLGFPGNPAITADIITLSATTLQLRWNAINGGVPFTYTVTYTAF